LSNYRDVIALYNENAGTMRAGERAFIAKGHVLFGVWSVHQIGAQDAAELGLAASLGTETFT
jgi:hypothetical protein